MRFIADESCDFAVVRTLRLDGHDVSAVAELTPRATDQEVIDRAYRERRVLLTEDKDFGRLVYVAGAKSPGVVLIRFPTQSRGELGISVSSLVRTLGPRLAGGFAVLQSGRVRFDPAIDSE